MGDLKSSKNGHFEWGFCKALGLPNGNVDREPWISGVPQFLDPNMDSHPEYLDCYRISVNMYNYWYWDTLGNPSKRINKFGMSQYRFSHHACCGSCSSPSLG